MTINVRPARMADARRLWRWANDPDTRRWSFSPDPILWDDHVAWLGRVLDDPDRVLLVGVDEYGEVGTVRFDVDGDECEVSITVAPECRGAAMSRPLLDAAMKAAPRSKVVAQVLERNVASVCLFGRWVVTSRKDEVVTLRSSWGSHRSHTRK